MLGQLMLRSCIALLAIVPMAGAVQAQVPVTSLQPVVLKTGKGPTGYTVTFHYRGPGAKSVQIQGEWYFSAPGHASPSRSQGLLPSEWKPGDFPIGWPNTGVGAAWPVAEMTKDRNTGVWSYTTPLPSGEFNYWYFVNCPSADGTGCTALPDPSNPAWNVHNGITTGSVEPTSQVYVPSDPAFGTVDYAWQAPTSPRGELRDVSYPTMVRVKTYRAADSRLAIYTPPGYDAHRQTPYPTLYLQAGAGSDEVDWSTRADAANILDNLIDQGQVRPMVVVMTNYLFIDCGYDDSAVYEPNLLQRVIPYVQANYDVSAAPSQRAFAGLSCGGGLAASLLQDDTNQFGYYGVFSPGPTSNVFGLVPEQAKAIKRVRVLFGGGSDDPIHQVALGDLSALNQAGVKVPTEFFNGGHDWYVWRILLRDFLTRVAFKPLKPAG
jgi:enterochelin esterase-like enzyme